MKKELKIYRIENLKDGKVQYAHNQRIIARMIGCTQPEVNYILNGKRKNPEKAEEWKIEEITQEQYSRETGLRY